MVINTTPGEHYSIDADRKITYIEKEHMNHFLLEKQKDIYSKIVLSIGEDGKKGYYINTLADYDLVSVRVDEKLSLKNTVEAAKDLFGNIDESRIDSFYSVPYREDDIVIDDSYLSDGYIRIIGKHYGQVTMTPYIAKMVCETVVGNLNAKPKRILRIGVGKLQFQKLSNEERQS